MIIENEWLDIGKIAESGQCFRMIMVSEGVYETIYNGKYLKINTIEDGFSYEFLCSEEEYDSLWKHYFDMDTDYVGINKAVDTEDSFLYDAVKFGKGIRILNQDPWEMIISFIISQRKSIPAIRTSVEKLCKLCGDKIVLDNGDVRYAFPTASQINEMSEEDILSCSVGYRAAYIKKAAEMVVSGEINLDELKDLSDAGLKDALLSLYGIGIKVASCVMLFGFHRLNAFPVDVWIERALKEHYPDGFPEDRYEGYAGIMQQYIFFYYRGR